MASEWLKTTLAAICEAQGGAVRTGPFGSQLHASDYSEVGTPVVMPLNLIDGTIETAGIARVSTEHVNRLARHRLKAGDIVFSRRGDVTRFALVRDREVGWLCGTGCLKVDVGTQSQATAEFISAALASPESKEWLVRHAVGATMPNLNTGILGALPITLPPRALQDEITETLGSLDGRIQLLRQTNTTLEAIAQALFKSWFVDFDPVRAKVEGREPEAMDAATAALFPSAFEELELGLIPRGWRTATLAELCKLNTAKWTARTHPPQIKYIDLSGVDKNCINSVSALPFEDAPSRARHHLRDGDTIVGTVRPGNRAFAYIHSPESNLTGSTGFAVLSPKHRHLSSFIYLSSTRDEAIDRLANLADGGAYPAVRPSVVSATPCVVAPDEVLVAFSALTRPLLERIGENRGTMEVLTALRDSLLPRLISGKLRLPAEAIGEAISEGGG